MSIIESFSIQLLSSFVFSKQLQNGTSVKLLLSNSAFAV